MCFEQDVGRVDPLLDEVVGSALGFRHVVAVADAARDDNVCDGLRTVEFEGVVETRTQYRRGSACPHRSTKHDGGIGFAGFVNMTLYGDGIGDDAHVHRAYPHQPHKGAAEGALQ